MSGGRALRFLYLRTNEKFRIVLLLSANYKSIKLMSHTIKLWEKVIKHGLREEMRIAENQFDFILEGLQQKSPILKEIDGKTLKKKGACVAYIQAIQDMYEGVTTSVRTPRGEILDVLTREIQNIIHNCILFADDIVLIEKLREIVNFKLEFWRQTLEMGFLLKSE
ncbi:hypothetical protein CR513_01470, partial [Mucuna pruriens]